MSADKKDATGESSNTKAKVTAFPFLMFQGGKAKEAIELYTSLFQDSKVTECQLWKAGEGATEGTIKTAKFTIAGQTVMAHDSPIKHEFDFTPSFSFFIECETEDAIKHLAKVLGKDGKEMMPLADYGFSKLFTWVGDRYGVSWQLNLK